MTKVNPKAIPIKDTFTYQEAKLFIRQEIKKKDMDFKTFAEENKLNYRTLLNALGSSIGTKKVKTYHNMIIKLLVILGYSYEIVKEYKYVKTK